MLKALTLIAVLGLPSAALAWQEPARGTNTRADLMDAIRPIAEWDLGRSVEFVISELRVQGNVAFAMVSMQRPGGGEIDIRRTPGYLRGQIVPEMMDGTTMQALYQRSGRQWVAVHYAIGATDVWFADPAFCPIWAPVLPELCQ